MSAASGKKKTRRRRRRRQQGRDGGEFSFSFVPFCFFSLSHLLLLLLPNVVFFFTNGPQIESIRIGLLIRSHIVEKQSKESGTALPLVEQKGLFAFFCSFFFPCSRSFFFLLLLRHSTRSHNFSSLLFLLLVKRAKKKEKKTRRLPLLFTMVRRGVIFSVVLALCW